MKLARQHLRHEGGSDVHAQLAMRLDGGLAEQKEGS